MKIAEIALDAKLDRLLDYEVPESLAEALRPGSFVEVPLKNSSRKGFVVSIREGDSPYPLKQLKTLLQEQPLLPHDLMQLASWMSGYYVTPLGDVLRCCIPSSVRGKAKPKEQYFVRRAKTREELIAALPQVRSKSSLQADVIDVMLKAEKGHFLTELLELSKSSREAVKALEKKGLLLVEKMKLERSPIENAEFILTKAKTLTEEQRTALQHIEEEIASHKFTVRLIHGITGSGKTEVYLRAIEKALSLNKNVIMMVPEISLTTQTIERFKSRFEGKIALLHHRLSDGERLDEWERIRSGQAPIVIGARSAVFSPVPNLGLIIVDEEHESSYKQTDSMPAYHARDLAVMRGRFSDALVLLGSATPSLESFSNHLSGKYQLTKLTHRPQNAELAHIKIVDMTREYEKKKGMTLFSEELLSEIQKRIERGEQSILFLNRRGYHTSLLCLKCKERVKCPCCDISLNYHKSESRVACHICGFSTAPPQHCPSCKEGEPLKFSGAGTEQVEAALHAIFPEIRTLRLDADTTKHKGSHQKLYKAFRTGKADVLIGTQMVAKGLHFPEVTLVGILNCDSGLQIPDFRASETTFQLLTQVAGRAGRGDLKGEVFIQTCLTENSVIQHAKAHNVEAFLKEELEVRKLFAFPPYHQLIKVRFSGIELHQVRQVAENFRLAVEREGVECSPVSPCGHAKIKEQHRLHLFVKGAKITPLIQAVQQVKGRFSLPKSVRLFIDVNPASTFF
jgi:primosomal protein N' (replication factor Y)